MNWRLVEQRQYDPPYVPLSQGYAKENFDDEFANAPAVLTPAEDVTYDDTDFVGFTYVNKQYIVHHYAQPARPSSGCEDEVFY